MEQTPKKFSIRSYKALCDSIIKKKKAAQEGSVRRMIGASPDFQNQMMNTIRKLKQEKNQRRAFSPQVQRKIGEANHLQSQAITFVPVTRSNPSGKKLLKERKLKRMKQKYNMLPDQYESMVSKVRAKIMKSNHNTRRFLSPILLRNKANLISKFKVFEAAPLNFTIGGNYQKKEVHDAKLPILKSHDSSEISCFAL
ncbi:unnamed protein product [Moneuplotes crassus]|uniref:Uncharacterized protein n=1 Tax=Euplotes crassus TaxID=5936 RepID=A0AAD1U5G7_EUPCR|nr:unnamed protein product [Moneuplotes crassus]